MVANREYLDIDTLIVLTIDDIPILKINQLTQIHLFERLLLEVAISSATPGTVATNGAKISREMLHYHDHDLHTSSNKESTLESVVQ
jgi:hypothetical protein